MAEVFTSDNSVSSEVMQARAEEQAEKRKAAERRKKEQQQQQEQRQNGRERRGKRRAFRSWQYDRRSFHHWSQAARQASSASIQSGGLC